MGGARGSACAHILPTLGSKQGRFWSLPVTQKARNYAELGLLGIDRACPHRPLTAVTRVQIPLGSRRETPVIPGVSSFLRPVSDASRGRRAHDLRDDPGTSAVSRARHTVVR